MITKYGYRKSFMMMTIMYEYIQNIYKYYYKHNLIIIK